MFSIQTAAVVGYIDKLISAGKIPDWDHAMGLYVFGRTDSQLKQLANSIIAERRTHQLRIATVETVLSLAELVQGNHIMPDEAVALLRPAGVLVGDTVQLLARVAAKALESPSHMTVVGVDATKEVPIEQDSTATTLGNVVNKKSGMPAVESDTSDRLFVMTPVRNEENQAARDTIQQFLSAGWYVFGESTPGRKRLKPGDRICFYEVGVGIVAEAVAASQPEKKPPSAKHLVKNLEKFPWSFRVESVRYFFDEPVVIDASLRSKLQAFAGRNPSHVWSWFVQPTRIVTEHDFNILTGNDDSA